MKSPQPALTKELSRYDDRRLTVPSVIDFEDERHRVKLVRDSGETRLYENRGGVDCPVCGDEFDEGLVTASNSRQVTPGAGVQLCIARDGGGLYLFTHA